ncbi:AsmA family protein [Vibrio alginolyticus]
MKKLLLILAIPIVVILVAILALTIFVNPNQFKPLIVEQAQKQTGLELVIEGDISWQFFPSIGFELGHTELRNPQGFSKPNLFKVDTVGVDISVMPLFSQQLEIGNVTLDGAEFYIETKKDGSKNIDALTKAQTQQAEQENNAAPTQNGETQTSGSDWSINLAGVTVSNGSLEMQDKQAGSYTKLYDISLNLSEFAFDNWTTADFGVKGEMNDQKFTAKGQADFKLEKGLANYALKNINFDATYSDPANKIESATIGLDTFEFDKVNNLTYAIKGDAGGMKLDMQGAGQLSVDKAISKVQLDKLTLKSTFEGDALPQSPMKVDMVSDLSFDLTKNHLSFFLEKLTANAIALDGKADVTLGDIPKVRFALHSPNIDLDEFLGLDKQAAEGNKPASGGESAPAGPEVEPDLSALKALDVKGDITIDKFKAANAKMEAVKTSFTVNRGVFELTSFSSKLYQGSISATAKLDARQAPATYSVKKSIKGVKVQPLLIDVAENDKLEGTGNIDVNVTGKSLTPTGIKKNLSGTVVINFADGAVNGINVAQLIRENYAKFKGQKVEGTNEAKKTDFSAMTATLKLNKGVVSTDNMQAQSPLLRVRGKGTANYINETVDFTISTSVVGSLEGQGGKDIDELKDITIPINVSGKWAEPKFKLVFDDVLKQKAQKEIDRGVEKLTDKIKDEKTKDAVDGLLKNLFN